MLPQARVAIEPPARVAGEDQIPRASRSERVESIDDLPGVTRNLPWNPASLETPPVCGVGLLRASGATASECGLYVVYELDPMTSRRNTFLG